MRRVYLDQNKWIDVARADHDRPGSERFSDALVFLRAAVESQRVSLPLSSAHYMETANRRHWESRRDLGLTMASLSRFHTIAPIDAIVPPEIDRALQQFFDVSLRTRALQPFGLGVAHAFNQPVPPYRIPDHLRDRVDDPEGFERAANDYQELGLLLGPSPEEEVDLEGYDPLAHLSVGESYAETKEQLRALRRSEGWHKGERASRVAAASAFADHLDPINDAFERAGLPAGLLLAQGREAVTEFIAAAPTMFASSEFERLRHASPKLWERQDLSDIASLAVAAVYCDVVVTEKLWVDAAYRAKLDSKLDTVFLTGVDQLVAALV